MGQALYRKYRSKSLDDIVGQEHITTTLKNAIRSGRISHAYLLTGPRGVGKTSIARILAHEINDLPYDDEAHLDIIEIDAASNRRIDEIRDLRDRVSTAPAAAKYKVYIIDEVHMLTREAFNALLKTLEEPPAHVVFILATTEAHKLPETIISRTQRYSFRPATPETIVQLLREIAAKEHIAIDDAALELIAKHADGSFRDSVSLLDQASSTNDAVSQADIERILGLAPAELVDELLHALETADSGEIVTTLSGLYDNGYEPAAIAAQLSARLRDMVLSAQATDAAATLQLLSRLLDVPAARSPKQLLEIVLLQSIVHASQTSVVSTAIEQHTPELATKAEPTPPQPTTQATTAKASPIVEAPPEEPPEKPGEVIAATGNAQQAPLTDITELWQATLNEIKKQYNTLYGIARMAQPELEGDKLTLTLKFAFHQKRLNEAKNRKLFADVVERLYGRPVEIICVVGETVKPAVAPTDVATISNIFGGAELLES